MPQGQQKLAIFDLDNTLLGGDSDHAWGEFLIDKGLVNADQYKKANDGFYADYNNGTLDINAYLTFALTPIAGQSSAALAPLHNEFMTRYVAPMRLAKADALLEQHRDAGDYLLIITATNDFVTRPIAKLLGVDAILASNAEQKNGVYTGKPTGTPCFQAGKVSRLNAWLADQSFDLAEACFYSDSHNDIPLLEAVGKAIAVDADAALQAHAIQAGWPCISLRNE